MEVYIYFPWRNLRSGSLGCTRANRTPDAPDNPDHSCTRGSRSPPGRRARRLLPRRPEREPISRRNQVQGAFRNRTSLPWRGPPSREVLKLAPEGPFADRRSCRPAAAEAHSRHLLPIRHTRWCQTAPTSATRETHTYNATSSGTSPDTDIEVRRAQCSQRRPSHTEQVGTSKR